MDQRWDSLPTALNKGIVSALNELKFDKMTPVQVL
jgi:hypothetical protein